MKLAAKQLAELRHFRCQPGSSIRLQALTPNGKAALKELAALGLLSYCSDDKLYALTDAGAKLLKEGEL